MIISGRSTEYRLYVYQFLAKHNYSIKMNNNETATVYPKINFMPDANTDPYILSINPPYWYNNTACDTVVIHVARYNKYNYIIVFSEGCKSKF